MQTARVKSPAKLNLTLNIKGVSGGYHMLDSVVTTIDLFDEITVKKREDGEFRIYMRGMGSEQIAPESNNAYRAATLFAERYNTGGADIYVNKNIPMGAGLGGSSADAAGTLNALAKLYCVNDNKGLGEIADAVGSDTRYMLGGGYARMCGRGNIIEKIESSLKLYFLIIAPQSGVSAAECYKQYDALPDGLRDNSDRAARAIRECNTQALCSSFYNALYAPARLLCPDVEKALSEALSFSPLGAAMTGSGSAVFAVFSSPELCAWAKSRYFGNFRAFCAKTYKP